MEIASHSVSHSHQFGNFPIGTGREEYPSYQPVITSLEQTKNGTILGELRVSKFLLEATISDDLKVVSFRPGYLAYPVSLPQALQTTDYLYSSSVTANQVWTHLPFQLAYNLDLFEPVNVFEFPVTVEDLYGPKMTDRLGEAIELAHKIKEYGGCFIISIHPDVLEHRFAFEKGFAEAVKSFSWFDSIQGFGNWWSARNQVIVDVKQNQNKIELNVDCPLPIEGLTIQIPKHWVLKAYRPDLIETNLEKGRLTAKRLEGQTVFLFEIAP